MSTTYLIRGATLINEGKQTITNVLLRDGKIAQIGAPHEVSGATVIEAEGKWLLPGVIDGQVHFREPGLTHKADIHSESRAAVAGGVTAFIDMPNTRPNVLSLSLLEEKYAIAATKSVANYGFLLGVNGDNLDEVLQTDTTPLLAVTDDGLYFTKKGNLLADNPAILEKLFAGCKAVIAIHAEKEAIIEVNEEHAREKYGEEVPPAMHPIIRSTEACYKASADAIALAKKHGARLHILHLSTAAETELFDNSMPLAEKKITTEASVHHLWFSDKDYERLGMRIKWNPAIKTEADRLGLLKALNDDRIDLITTDHAPHTLDEKLQPYFTSMSGAPLVQHSLVCMIELHKQGYLSLEKLVEKMCHNPAILYRIAQRGFVREGYWADLVLVDPQASWEVQPSNILYKCGWSPLEGTRFSSQVTHTFVNGQLAYENGQVYDEVRGMALEVSSRR